MKKLLLVLLVTIFLACDSEESISDSGDEPVAQSISAYGANLSEQTVKQAGTTGEMPVAYLELCYATSINIPEDQYRLENVFDNDPDTYWATMPGAGPDEGIYFSFTEPIEVYEIYLKTVTGSREFDGIKMVRPYINGLEGGTWNPEYSRHISGPMKSLFVRIWTTDSTHLTEQGIRYQRDVPVAISEIRVTVIDDDGREVPLCIVPIAEVTGSVEASSSLEPVEAYGPDFLFDSRPAFGWADGNENSSGAGESLTFHFDEPQHIEKVKIWNGYHRSTEHFEHNERASLISFGLENSTTAEYSLDDTMESQIVNLDSPLDGSSFTMDFLEVYPGEVYNDLVVSEMRFFDGDEWFILDTGNDEVRKMDNLEWARNCDAESFIDRQIYCSTIAPDEYLNDYQSLVIRSNGSFVLWKVDELYDSNERMYADGNWQIVDDNSIRIFGRLHRLASYDQDRYDPYAGSWSDQDERLDRMTIFNDTLEFGDGWIRSTRGLFEDFEF